MGDNRRRINEEILEEIQEEPGNTFTEKLLSWKNSKDNMSEELADTIESLKNIGDEGRKLEEVKQDLEIEDNVSADIDYTYIESKIEEHADRIIETLGR